MHVVFVAPFLMEATLRFVRAAAALPGVTLSLASEDPLEKLPADLKSSLAGYHQLNDAFDPMALVAAAASLAKRVAPVERLIGSLEQLQEPLARASATLGLPALGVEAARNFRDKARMKDVLRAHGLPCARHCLAARVEEAREFIASSGFPVVAKPPAGAGAAATHRLDSSAMLEQYFARYAPRAGAPVLIEEYLSGTEHSFDSISIDSRLVWWSVSRYLPAPLTVLENPWIQWCVLLPRELDGYEDIRAAGEKALGALGLVTGMTHMEWFRRPDGTLAISEVAARPPGAQFTSLLSYAHDLDFYSAWARLVTDFSFKVPARRYAVGAAYVRGQGTGRVRAIHGLDLVQAEFGALIIEAKLPRAGEVQPGGYEGVGHIILRAPETAVIEAALRRIVSLIRVELA